MNKHNKINTKIIFIGMLLFSNVSQADYKLLFNNSQSKGLIPEKTESVFSSCKEVLEQNPDAQSGIYTINIQNEPLDVKCEMDLNGGGWTLVAQGGLVNGTTLNSSWMTTGWYNKGQQTNNVPFKMPDSVINELKTYNIMARISSAQHTEKLTLPHPSCIYNHVDDNTSVCHVRYNIDGSLQGNDEFSRKAEISTGLFGANYRGGGSPTGYNEFGNKYGNFTYMWVR